MPSAQIVGLGDAGAACDDRFGPSERPFPTEVSAVPAQGLGLLTLDIPGQSGLLVRLAGFDLVFSVENTRLAEMARDMNPILAALGAGGEPQ